MKGARTTPPTLTEVLDLGTASAHRPALPSSAESMPVELAAPQAPARSSELPTVLDAEIEARVRAAVAALMPAWQEALVRAVTAAVTERLRSKPTSPRG